VPYRVDIDTADSRAFDYLVELGALDAERLGGSSIAAVMPDSVSPEQVAAALGVHDIRVSPAQGRDDGSVWVLNLPQRLSVGRTLSGPALELIDAAAFGTGLHPTTALCLEAIEDRLVGRGVRDPGMLDVGTGSGVLALAALKLGVPQAVGIDIDEEALRVAAENARINGLESRLQLVHGGPEAVDGTWPLVVANVLAAPLIEMAPVLVRRVGHHGELLLSGIASGVEEEVERVYRRLGMHRLQAESRAGWVTLVMQASW
jgi:ribosomal protein L11 methylase PrmA